MQHSPVYEEIVLNNLCIGCGTCVAICPKQRLSTEWNDQGCYQIREDDQPCAKRCNLCLKVCPFADGHDNEDEMGYELFGDVQDVKHHPVLGYFQSSYGGYSIRDGQREKGASGGMATWFLTELLRKNIVDYVVCVRPDSSPNPFLDMRSVKPKSRFKMRLGQLIILWR